MAVGFSSGVISTLDLRTGLMIASWKAHEGEILQIKAYNDKSFVTSSFDQHMNYWNYDEVKPVCSMKGEWKQIFKFVIVSYFAYFATLITDLNTYEGSVADRKPL